MKSNILVSGSLVIDTLFDLQGSVAEQLSLASNDPELINLMFTAKDRNEYFGGNAGNIAYGLGLLKHSPFVISAVGRDFEYEYETHLKKIGSKLKLLNDDRGFTATYYGMTDARKKQIGVFQPNSYYKLIEKISPKKLLTARELQGVEFAIVSPGTGPTMLKTLKELRKIKNNKVFTILDPGQTLLATFDKSILRECLRYSDLLIVNEVEFKDIQHKFGFYPEEIDSLGTKFIIETKAEHGSILHENGKKPVHVPAKKVSKVVDPTGAGDAYRAGLISGLSQGLSMNKAMELGSKLGAACVKTKGGQTYSCKI